MKVCFVTPFFYPVKGGVENHVFFVAKGLIARGYDVEVVTSDAARDGRLARTDEKIEGVPVKRLRTWFRLGKFSPVFPSVFAYVRKSDADIIHIHNYRHPTNLIPFLTEKKCVLTPHWPNYPKGLRRKIMDGIVPLFDLTLGKVLLKRFERVCAVSKPEEVWLQKGMNVQKNKIMLTPNGISQRYFTKEKQQVARKRLTLRHNKLVVLSVGRVHASKGFDQIIKVAQRLPQVRFFILGPDGGFRKHLELLQEALQVKNVSFVGEVSEEQKLLWYGAADVFLHPSRYEAFGISVLEAMAQKLPVLVSNAGGLPWLVEGGGLVFHDSHDLYRKLERLINNKKQRQAWGMKGFKKARKFTWENTVQVIDRMYKGL